MKRAPNPVMTGVLRKRGIWKETCMQEKTGVMLPQVEELPEVGREAGKDRSLAPLWVMAPPTSGFWTSGLQKS